MTAHGSFRRIPSVARSVVGYLFERIPPHTQGIALVGAYVCSWLWYRRFAGGEAAAVRPSEVAAFVLMFLLLRLVDDLDDVSADYPDDAEAARSRYRNLALGYVAACAVFVVLEFSNARSLGLLAAFVVLSILTPTLLKRWMRPRRMLLFVGYEGMPLLATALPWAQWRAVAGGRVSLVTAAAVTVMFWGCYEVWKFARRPAVVGYAPYRLAWPQRRRLLLAMLISDVGLGIALIVASGAGVGFGLALAGVGAIFSAWILLAPMHVGQVPIVAWLPPLGYAGLAYAFCFEVVNIVFLMR